MTNLQAIARLDTARDAATEMMNRLDGRPVDGEVDLSEEEQRALIAVHELLIEMIREIVYPLPPRE